MTMKEFIVKKLAVNRVATKMISEKIIDTVISHQFESAHVATATHNTIEISGFGKFSFNQGRANKQMIKYNSQVALFTEIINNPLTSPTLKRNTEMRLATTLLNIKDLKPKLNECITNSGGLEK